MVSSTLLMSLMMISLEVVKMENTSDLSFINVTNANPIHLYKEWEEEYQKYVKKVEENLTIMNIATATKNGFVSNRNVLLEDLIDDNFVFFTDVNSKKVKDITENPQISACFHFNYRKDNEVITRQVRVEGKVEKMSYEGSVKYYDRKQLFCKIRSYICRQGKQVDWTELKKQHDNLLKEVSEQKKELPMPNTVSAYKIIPERIEFYSALTTTIGDRVSFEKLDNGKWKHVHLAA